VACGGRDDGGGGGGGALIVCCAWEGVLVFFGCVCNAGF
jgi:hypothetical protein